MATFAPAQRGPFAPSATVAAHAPPAGTFIPGTKVQVGDHRVVIEKYLSEGGFAHVYVVRLPKPVEGNDLAVLKRVAVPDKENLANMRTEVETMKRLRGQKYIVKYMDSHASQLKGGGYEVFLLMEYCAGGGLIDFMNTRLQQRLTEPEILKIFTDVAEGVASMHYLKPPLLHRDLKVENVLISGSRTSRMYKVCDFGSAAPPRPAATTAAEGRLIEDDVQRHTTLQYRSPEMIDVYRKQPIDEKSDIWALGVLLYKLCYYTTPFEEVGQMAILNASFKYPSYPAFSDQLKLLIATMLRETPAKRPNIYQVLSQACKMQGKEVPIRDIYTGRSQSESAQNKVMPPNPSSQQSRAGATLSPPKPQSGPSIPDIAPMRRGRPSQPVSRHGSAKPSPSPLRMIDSSDPFASLDGGRSSRGDELSGRFPTLEQFSLLADNNKRFDFKPASSDKKAEGVDSDLAVRVSHALADEAFATSSSTASSKTAPITDTTASSSRTALQRKFSTDRREVQSFSPPEASSSLSNRASSASNTITSPISTSFQASSRPIWRVPSPGPLSSEKTRPKVPEKGKLALEQPGTKSRLANLLHSDAARSQPSLEKSITSPTSSRPSLEGGRPSAKDLGGSVARSRSLNIRNRPFGVHLGRRPSHAKDESLGKSGLGSSSEGAEGEAQESAIESETNIASDVDFLKSKEEEEKLNKHHKRQSSGSMFGKRASLSSLSLSGTKNLLTTGKFGDVLRRFENNSEEPRARSRSSSPSRGPEHGLTPIAGSEATDLSEDRPIFDETEDLSPEMRRELEKRRLEAEEKRVANAAAEYRRRLGQKGQKGAVSGRDPGRATSIQNKVQSLLKENGKPAVKTAAGYGRFTDIDGGQVRRSETLNSTPQPRQQEPVGSTGRDLKAASAPPSALNLKSVLPSTSTTSRPPARPSAPPKPKVLRAGADGTKIPEAAGEVAAGGTEPVNSGDDWEANFTKKYPSLSGIEMVETDIDAMNVPPLRTREV